MKRKIITSQMRRQWAEQVARGEKTETEISEETGVRFRTVRAHITRGREELAFEEAKANAFRSALEAHYRDLCGLANHLNRALELQPKTVLPRGLALPPRRGRLPRVGKLSGSTLHGYPHADKLIVALAQHLPRSPLWSGLRKWDQLADDFEDSHQRVKAKAKEEAGKARLNDAGGIQEAVALHVDSRASGGAGLLPLSPWEIKDRIAYGGAFGVAHLPAEAGEAELQEIRMRFDSVARGGEDWLETRERTDLYTKARDLRAYLGEELEAIVLRRVLPGQCRYCPGGGEEPRRRKRRPTE